MLYKLEQVKHYLGVEYYLRYFCSPSFSLISAKVLKGCVALFGVEVNQISCVCILAGEQFKC